MNTILPPSLASSRRSDHFKPAANGETRSPHYDCLPHGDHVELTVFLPGVDAAGVEIVVRGPDLVVVGRKTHIVRVNFAAANLESVQLDYELRLRLGRDLDYSTLTAALDEGILSVRIPRRSSVLAAAA